MVAEKIAVAPAIAQLRGEIMTLLASVEDEELLQEMFRHLQKQWAEDKISKIVLEIKALYSKGEFQLLKEALHNAEVSIQQKAKSLGKPEQMNYLKFVSAMRDIAQPITFHDSKRVAQLIEEVSSNSMAEKEWVLSKLETLREDADWNRLAMEQFFAGYTEADSVYDKL